MPALKRQVVDGADRVLSAVGHNRNEPRSYHYVLAISPTVPQDQGGEISRLPGAIGIGRLVQETGDWSNGLRSDAHPVKSR